MQIEVRHSIEDLPRVKVDFVIDFNESLFDCIQEGLLKHGNRFVIETTEHGLILVENDPEVIKYILQSNNRNYTKGIGIDKVKILLGNGIMVSEGSFWKRQRRFLQPAFARKYLQGLESKLLTQNKLLIENWRKKSEAGDVINIHEDMSLLSLNIILSSIFSDDIEASIQSGKTPFSILADEFERDMKFALKFRSLRKYITQIINNRIEKDEWPNDFLSIIIQSRSSTGEPMSQKEMIDEIITLIVAGHETTASALSWCWKLLVDHQRVYEALKAEVRNIEELSYEHIKSSDLIKNVIKESLRLFPPGWLITRESINNDLLDGVEIRNGTNVIMSLYALQRNSHVWENPNAFVPDRFRSLSANQKQSFLPYSFGPRKCIGDQLAMMEMEIHLAMICKFFDLTSVKTEQKDIGIVPHINLRPREPILMKPNIRTENWT